MIDGSFLTTHLVLAYSAYAIGTASPGPSNLSIMAIAMHQGRRAALIFALGVVSGSLVWGVLAAFGLSAVLASYSQALVAMKILGGIYLLWLSLKAARSALTPMTVSVETGAISSDAGLYVRGAALHLTNPKAILVWLSIVALALPDSSQRNDSLLVVAGCVPVGIAVFFGYALAFSTVRARQAYVRVRRWFEGALAIMFAYAGIRMLVSRMPT